MEKILKENKRKKLEAPKSLSAKQTGNREKVSLQGKELTVHTRPDQRG